MRRSVRCASSFGACFLSRSKPGTAAVSRSCSFGALPGATSSAASTTADGTFAAMSDVTVWFNPSCSKCRTTQGILQERGVDADYVRYLDQAPTRERLVRVLGLLGTTDPRAIVRTGEPVWKELALTDA